MNLRPRQPRLPVAMLGFDLVELFGDLRAGNLADAETVQRLHVAFQICGDGR